MNLNAIPIPSLIAMNKSLNKTLEAARIVLCVDDDADDRELVCIAIKEIDPSVKVVHAQNGVEAIEYLFNAKSTDELPCLVIMDINMPKMDGKSALACIKKDEHLNELPIVIFSTSANPLDKLYCSKYGVQYITKPDSILSLHKELKTVLKHCIDD